MAAMSKVEEGAWRIRSALLVDVDNMFLGLQAISPAAAAVFVADPDRWMHWLTDLSYPRVGGDAERDILVRACYLNPNLGGVWRSSFVQAGFQVVDCPTLTMAGKNSADIHMVIAMLDLLAHPTHFDEIIVMSSDADFTPALLRIRAHDRRTVVVTSGRHAPVLQASCDHLVSASTFVQEALADSSLIRAQPPLEGSSSAATGVVAVGAGAAVKKAAARKAPAKKTAVKKTAVKKVVVQPAAKKAPAKKAAAEVTVKKAPAQKVVAKKAPAKKAVKKASVATDTVGLPADARARTGDAVRRMVAGSAVPVVLAKIAGPVRSALGPDLAPSWDGARGLKKLLQQLDLAGLTVSGGTPGYVYDPVRHPKP
jgi:hypothetical protein